LVDRAESVEDRKPLVLLAGGDGEGDDRVEQAQGDAGCDAEVRKEDKGDDGGGQEVEMVPVARCLMASMSDWSRAISSLWRPRR
jgi:hypothetical protein